MRLCTFLLPLVVLFSAHAEDIVQPTAVFVAVRETDEPTSVQMEKAREALRNQDFDTAITIFNTVLLLPPNRFSQEAQARIGVAYERSKKYTKAMAEYKAYIDMYPNSDIIESMRRRLLTLEVMNPRSVADRSIPNEPRKINETTVESSVSTYYITSQDSSSLIHNVHVNGSFKRDEYTTRVIVKEGGNTEIKPSPKSKYALNIATVEVENTFQDWKIKLGRQSAEFGVLSKFDGIAVTNDFNKDTEYTLVLGKPLMGNSTSKRNMYGAHLHHTLGDNTTLTMAYNHQTADGFEERSAVGGDIRYFKDSLSITAGAEYDLAYRQVNHITLQAHHTGETTRWFVLYDRRKSPVLYADKALKLGLFTDLNMPYNSVAEALRRSGMSVSDLQDYIVSETSVASSFAIGGAYALGNWTLGGDIQLATMSGTPTEPQESSVRSISVNAFNPKIYPGHSFNGIVSYSTSDNGLYSLTMLDSTSIASLKVDTTVRFTNRKNALLSVSTHHKLSKDAYLELQLMLSKMRDEIDKTLILGFRYEF